MSSVSSLLLSEQQEAHGSMGHSVYMDWKRQTGKLRLANHHTVRFAP